MRDIAAECAQALRKSTFEYEQLLGSSVERVWLGVSRAVERNLISRRGVSIPGLGKLGFYKDPPHSPVFLLSDRFLQSYRGISWRQKPPPVPLGPTSELNMAVIGSEVGLARDQSYQSLEQLLRFIGNKLQSGSASSKLAIGTIGSFSLEGRSISFSFDTGFAKQLPQVQQQSPKATDRSEKLTKNCEKNATAAKSNLKRSATVDGPLIAPTTSEKEANISALCLDSIEKSIQQVHSIADLNLSTDGERNSKKEKHTRDTRKSSSHRHHNRHRSHSSTHSKALSQDEQRSSCKSSPQVLPRFLIPEPSVPVKSSRNRVNQELAMDTAFEMEKARLTGIKQANDRYQQELEARQRATQLDALQRRAEKIVGQRNLNAFLHRQIDEKHDKRCKDLATAEALCDPSAVTILPMDRALSDEAKREQKQKLNKCLNEQVAAKTLLKKDRRIVDQAEMAYFISHLNAQAEKEAREYQSYKLAAKQKLLADWSQQLELRTLQKELLHSQ